LVYADTLTTVVGPESSQLNWALGFAYQKCITASRLVSSGFAKIRNVRTPSEYAETVLDLIAQEIARQNILERALAL
jgi:hypothetical protein